MQAGAVVSTQAWLTSAACFPENCIFLTATTSSLVIFLACGAFVHVRGGGGCVCVCVCVCEGRRWCACVCEGRRWCVCVCEGRRWCVCVLRGGIWLVCLSLTRWLSMMRRGLNYAPHLPYMETKMTSMTPKYSTAPDLSIAGVVPHLSHTTAGNCTCTPPIAGVVPLPPSLPLPLFTANIR